MDNENDLTEPLTAPEAQEQSQTLEINMIEDEESEESSISSTEVDQTSPENKPEEKLDEKQTSQVPKGLPPKRKGIFMNSNIDESNTSTEVNPVSESQSKLDTLKQLNDEEEEESDSDSASQGEQENDKSSAGMTSSDDEISEAELEQAEETETLLDEEKGINSIADEDQTPAQFVKSPFKFTI